MGRLSHFAVLMFVGLLSGCLLPGMDPGLGDGIEVQNETEFTLHFSVWASDKSYDLGVETGPGQIESILGGSAIGPNSLVTENGCTTGDVVAFDPDGNEIARHSAPLCVDDRWVIETSATPSP